MIVTTGKSIKIDVGSWRLQVERTCETPGKVIVSDGEGGRIGLPAHPAEAEKVIAAYRRAIEEDIPYRQMASESACSCPPYGDSPETCQRPDHVAARRRRHSDEGHDGYDG